MAAASPARAQHANCQPMLYRHELRVRVDLEQRMLRGTSQLTFKAAPNKVEKGVGPVFRSDGGAGAGAGYELRLHVRQSVVNAVHLNGTPATFEQHDFLASVLSTGGATAGAADGANSASENDAGIFDLQHRAAIAAAQRGELCIALPEDIAVGLTSGTGAECKLIVSVEFALQNPVAGATFLAPDEASPNRPRHMYACSPADGSGSAGDGARLWFPCFEPGWGFCACPFEIALTVKANLMAIATGVLVEQTDVDADADAGAGASAGVDADAAGHASHAAADPSSGGVGWRTFTYLSESMIGASQVAIAVGPFLALPDPVLRGATHFCLPGSSRAAAMRYGALRVDARGRSALWKAARVISTELLLNPSGIGVDGGPHVGAPAVSTPAPPGARTSINASPAASRESQQEATVQCCPFGFFKQVFVQGLQLPPGSAALGAGSISLLPDELLLTGAPEALAHASAATAVDGAGQGSADAGAGGGDSGGGSKQCTARRTPGVARRMLLAQAQGMIQCIVGTACYIQDPCDLWLPCAITGHLLTRFVHRWLGDDAYRLRLQELHDTTVAVDRDGRGPPLRPPVSPALMYPVELLEPRAQQLLRAKAPMVLHMATQRVGIEPLREVLQRFLEPPLKQVRDNGRALVESAAHWAKASAGPVVVSESPVTAVAGETVKGSAQLPPTRPSLRTPNHPPSLGAVGAGSSLPKPRDIPIMGKPQILALMGAQKDTNTKGFMKQLKKRAGTVEDLLDNFKEHWIEGTGVAQLTAGTYFNHKTRKLHVVLRQRPHPVTQKLFTGQVLVERVEEDGPFPQHINISTEVHAVEHSVHAQKARRPTRTGDKAKAAQEDDLGPVRWVRFDPDFCWLRDLRLVQPWHMWAEQLACDADADAHVEALRALACHPVPHERPSFAAVEKIWLCLKGDTRSREDLRSGPKGKPQQSRAQSHSPSVRAHAAHALATWQLLHPAATARNTGGGNRGLGYLVSAYKELWYDPDTNLPRAHGSSHGAPSTVIQSAIVQAVARIVAKDGFMPAQGKDFLLELLRSHDVDRNSAIDDAEVLAHLVTAVGNVRPDALLGKEYYGSEGLMSDPLSPHKGELMRVLNYELTAARVGDRDGGVAAGNNTDDHEFGARRRANLLATCAVQALGELDCTSSRNPSITYRHFARGLFPDNVRLAAAQSELRLLVRGGQVAEGIEWVFQLLRACDGGNEHARRRAASLQHALVQLLHDEVLGRAPRAAAAALECSTGVQRIGFPQGEKHLRMQECGGLDVVADTGAETALLACGRASKSARSQQRSQLSAAERAAYWQAVRWQVYAYLAECDGGRLKLRDNDAKPQDGCRVGGGGAELSAVPQDGGAFRALHMASLASSSRYAVALNARGSDVGARALCWWLIDRHTSGAYDQLLRRSLLLLYRRIWADSSEAGDGRAADTDATVAQARKASLQRMGVAQLQGAVDNLAQARAGMIGSGSGVSASGVTVVPNLSRRMSITFGAGGSTLNLTTGGGGSQFGGAVGGAAYGGAPSLKRNATAGSAVDAKRLKLKFSLKS